MPIDRDALHTPLDPQAGETAGYVTPGDVKTSLDILADANDELAVEGAHAYEDIIAMEKRLLARITGLETHTSAPAPSGPVIEGRMLVDKYSGSFVRVRAEAGLDITDGLDHWVTFHLATAGEVGPGGEAYPDVTAVTGSAVWYDVNGSLGKVHGPTDLDISATPITNYIKGGRYCRVAHSVGADTHPVLTIKENIPPPTAP
jgi:hypothetical protein